jgi:hypothetical protein
LEQDPQAFQEGAVRVLRSSARGIQYVVSLLVTSNHLLEVLCDASLTREEAVMLARTAMQADKMTDINLAMRLAGDASPAISGVAAGRLMEILDEVSNGNRIMPSLLRLLQHSDPQLRSKAVLMIGRSSHSVTWVQSRLGDADPRARANAVEALWGLETDEAREFLRVAARDENSRVGANALAGLYLIGDSWAIPELLKMASVDSPTLRTSAAWAMGQTGDRRFGEALGRMMCDANAVVRKRAFSALGRIKAGAAQARQGSEWRVAAQVLPTSDGAFRFSLEAALADSSTPPQLLATQFMLTEGGQLVNTYQVEERPAPEALSLSFIFPHAAEGSVAPNIGRDAEPNTEASASTNVRVNTEPNAQTGAATNAGADAAPWVAGALACLAWKRPSDLWRAMFFREGKEPAATAPKPPDYTANPEAAAAALNTSPQPADCADFWSVLRAAAQDDAPASGARRLVVYCPADPGLPTDAPGILSAAVASKLVIYAIAGASNAILEELCQKTHGRFRIAVSADDSRRLVEEAHLVLLSRFVVTYQPLAPDASSLHIRVANTNGWGETTLAW